MKNQCSCLWLVHPFAKHTDHHLPVYAEWCIEQHNVISVWMHGINDPTLDYAVGDRSWRYVEVEPEEEPIQ